MAWRLGEYQGSLKSGQRLSYSALRSRFDSARVAAKVSFQFRDIRAKAATDADDLPYAQKLLGHKHQTMTQHYTRNRKGETMRPLKVTDYHVCVIIRFIQKQGQQTNHGILGTQNSTRHA